MREGGELDEAGRRREEAGEDGSYGAELLVLDTGGLRALRADCR